MEAWALDAAPGAYRWRTVDRPELGPDDVLVRVRASALNRMELWMLDGVPADRLPLVPRADVAGTVEQVGDRVVTTNVGAEVVLNPAVSPLEDIAALGNDSPLGPGFAVLGERRWGGHATHVVVPAHNVVVRPQNRTWFECAAYPLAYLTAVRMLRRARVAAGQTMLVVGVGSGVAAGALALGAWMGAEVHVTSRDPIKRRRALELGAAAAYDSVADHWPVKADIIVDSVGPATWKQSTRSLKRGGRLVICGRTSGPTVEVDLVRLFLDQIEIIGSSMGSYEEFALLTTLVERGLPIIVDEVFPLDGYPDALDRMARAEQLGKIVLDHG